MMLRTGLLRMIASRDGGMKWMIWKFGMFGMQLWFYETAFLVEVSQDRQPCEKFFGGD